MQDEFNLERFVAAQGNMFDTVLRELRAGEKRSHWMWFIFPQLAGLGHSATARHYAISGLDEARAYLHHAVLGSRLLTCTRLTLAVPQRTAHEIFGAPDDLKFRSCMTLFAEAAPDEAAFGDALTRFFASEPDPRTLTILRA